MTMQDEPSGALFGPAARKAPHASRDMAKFVTGSTLRHVLVMTATGSIGLIAIFVVDLLSLIYISWLGNPHLTAGVGFATQVSFLLFSFSIGASIAVGALVARALGAGDLVAARRLAASTTALTTIATALLSLLALPFIHKLVSVMGARGETLDVATTFLYIVLPSNGLMGLGMALSSVLRAAGDARRSMYVTLWGAAVTAVLDPILIFGFKMGVVGAAISVVVSRLAFVAVGYWGVMRGHGLLGRPRWRRVLRDVRPMAAIALPATITNLAAPVANIFAIRIFASYGEGVIAGVAINDRIVPVAFGVLFAMSGSVGPIVGQNYGARRFDRIRQTLGNCFAVSVVYGLSVWLLLALAAPLVVGLFGAQGDAARMILFFCHWGAGMWLFLGLLFTANAGFNNLGYPMLATLFNWGRATLGTIPFVMLGAQIGGPEGGIVGIGAGAAAFGLASVATSYWIVRRLGRNKSP